MASFMKVLLSAATTPPAPVNQVFSSFELIASPEIAEAILAAIAAQEELAEQSESEEQTGTNYTNRRCSRGRYNPFDR